MEIIFVIVVYNNYTDTIDCVSSIADLEKGDWPIRCTVVDNSDDNNVKIKIDSIKEKFKFVEILRPKNNLGYFGAFNYFFSKNGKLGNSFIALCNNDLMFDKKFGAKLQSSRYPEDVFVICPDIITLEGRHQNPHVLKPRSSIQRLKLDLYFSHFYVACALRWVQRIGKLLIRRRTRTDAGKACYLHMGIGACYILRPVFFDKFKQLEFPHFIYGEEAYLSKQVHDAGGRLYYDPNLKILHKESVTLSKLPKRKTYEFGRDGYWSYRKFY